MFRALCASNLPLSLRLFWFGGFVLGVAQAVDAVRTIVNGALDSVISADGGTLYASDPSGYVTAYNLTTGAQIGRWQVGTRLGGMDVSADGHYLVAVELLDPNTPYNSNVQATVHRLDLTTGQVQNFTTGVSYYESAFHDVAFMADGKVILTQDFRGSGWVPLTSLDFSTGIFTRSGSYSQAGVLSPALNHGSALFAPENSSGGDLYVVSSSSGALSYATSAGGYNYGVQAYSAGHFAAQYVYSNLYVYDGALTLKVDLTAAHPELRTAVGGLAFDPTGSHLYVWEPGYSRILEFSTTDWTIERSFSVGANSAASNWQVYGDGLNVSADGQYLIVTGQSKVQVVTLANVVSDNGTDHDDRLTGTTGADTFDAYKGVDRVDGGLGSDQIHGGDGDDFLTGDGAVTAAQAPLAGSDYIWGDAGNDSLFGGGGNDTLYGGDGDDWIWTAGAQFQNDGSYQVDTSLADLGVDYIDGGAGTDTAVLFFNNATKAVAINFDGNLGVPNPSYTLYLGGSAHGTLTSIENLIVYGGSGDDALTGGAGRDVFSGSSGADALSGSGGDDTLDGGDGADVLDGGVGADLLLGGLGDDSLTGGAGSDTASYLTGGLGVSVSLALAGPQAIAGAGVDTLVGIENLIGSAYGDTLYGDDGANRLEGMGGNDGLAGGAGDDVLDGGAGQDYLVGGAGNDSYIVDDVTEAIVENADEGTDVVYANVSYGLGANVEVLYLGATGDLNGVGNDIGNTLFGNTHDNYLTGLGGADALLGGDGNDHEYGGDGEDYLYGQNGDDWLVGDAGFDHLYGEAGIDVLIGGAGDDLMAGGVGDDGYVVDSATDLIVENAGEGADVVYAFANYTLAANVENLWLFDGANGGAGNAGDNLLVANLNVGSTLYGQAGADALVGENGDDFLYGGLDNDFLNGQAGADTLVGGQGSDLLYGGTGADTFLYAAVSDSIGAAGNMDAILDFEVGIDKVNLHGVLGGVGDSVSLLTNGDGTYILVDLAGDGSEDMRILLYHTTGVTMSDLVF